MNYIQFKDGTFGAVQQTGDFELPAGATKITARQYESLVSKANKAAEKETAASVRVLEKRRAAALKEFPQLEGLI